MLLVDLIRKVQSPITEHTIFYLKLKVSIVTATFLSYSVPCLHYQVAETNQPTFLLFLNKALILISFKFGIDVKS